MIDHLVLIDGEDVSADVISVKIQDQIETDSDPGKCTIVLANRGQKYTARFTPQETPLEVTFYNFVYDTKDERYTASKHGEPEEYLAFTGHVKDVSANHSEATVVGECDLGHLSDAIGQDYDSTNKYLTPFVRDILEDVLALHKDLKIKLHYNARNIPIKGGKKYNSDTTFQWVLEDLRNDVGAVYYFSESGVLEFRDPTVLTAEYGLDPYVLNPDATESIMGFRNSVTVIGSASQTEWEDCGITSPESNHISYTARDDKAGRDGRANAKAEQLATLASTGDADAIEELGLSQMFTQDQLDKAIETYVQLNGGAGSIETLGVLEAPADRAPYCKTEAECKTRAELLLNFYKLFKNALTKPKVVGIVPPLHSKVSYSVFIPISDQSTSAGTVTGIVVGRNIEYSIDGLFCDLTVSPGALDMDKYIEDEDIEDFTLNFGDGEE